MKISLKKCATFTVLALSVVSFQATAAIINNVDFPDEFVQSKAKSATPAHEQEMVAANSN